MSCRDDMFLPSAKGEGGTPAGKDTAFSPAVGEEGSNPAGNGASLSPARGKRIGILGGSFDPIHVGHLNIAESARREHRLDEVWFVPAGHSPNKDEADMSSPEDRVKMVELAIADCPFFRLSMAEMGRPGTSYTYLTLERLAGQYPAVRFYFIMGADSLEYFEHWKHPEIIAENAAILVAVRDDRDILEIQEKIRHIKALFHAEIYPLKGGRTDISSTELRRAAERGCLDTRMLPGRVAEYIRAHGLYIPQLQGFR